MTTVNSRKWVSGQAIAKGDYIMPKLTFEPNVIEQDVNGVKHTFTQLVKYYKGAGRFKSGVPIGVLPTGEPVTLYVDIRIGKKPNPNQSSESISKIEL